MNNDAMNMNDEEALVSLLLRLRVNTDLRQKFVAALRSTTRNQASDRLGTLCAELLRDAGLDEVERKLADALEELELAALDRDVALEQIALLEGQALRPPHGISSNNAVELAQCKVKITELESLCNLHQEIEEARLAADRELGAELAHKTARLALLEQELHARDKALKTAHQRLQAAANAAVTTTLGAAEKECPSESCKYFDAYVQSEAKCSRMGLCVDSKNTELKAANLRIKYLEEKITCVSAWVSAAECYISNNEPYFLERKAIQLYHDCSILHALARQVQALLEDVYNESNARENDAQNFNLSAKRLYAVFAAASVRFAAKATMECLMSLSASQFQQCPVISTSRFTETEEALKAVFSMAARESKPDDPQIETLYRISKDLESCVFERIMSFLDDTSSCTRVYKAHAILCFESLSYIAKSYHLVLQVFEFYKKATNQVTDEKDPEVRSFDFVAAQITSLIIVLRDSKNDTRPKKLTDAVLDALRTGHLLFPVCIRVICAVSKLLSEVDHGDPKNIEDCVKKVSEGTIEWTKDSIAQFCNKVKASLAQISSATELYHSILQTPCDTVFPRQTGNAEPPWVVLGASYAKAAAWALGRKLRSVAIKTDEDAVLEAARKDLLAAKKKAAAEVHDIEVKRSAEVKEIKAKFEKLVEDKDKLILEYTQQVSEASARLTNYEKNYKNAPESKKDEVNWASFFKGKFDKQSDAQIEAQRLAIFSLAQQLGKAHGALADQQLSRHIGMLDEIDAEWGEPIFNLEPNHASHVAYEGVRDTLASFKVGEPDTRFYKKLKSSADQIEIQLSAVAQKCKQLSMCTVIPARKMPSPDLNNAETNHNVE